MHLDDILHAQYQRTCQTHTIIWVPVSDYGLATHISKHLNILKEVV